MNETKAGRGGKRLLRRIGIAVLALLLIALAVLWGLWGNELRTVASFRKLTERDDAHLDGAVYEMRVAGDYYFDDFLAQGGVSSDAELIAFITDKLTKGVIDLEFTPPDVACSSFTARLENGHQIFARNYDYEKTNTCIVYTDPGQSRHASVSTADLQFLGIDREHDVTGLMDRITCLAAPYIPFDGMNDAGVSCGIYMTYQGPEESVATDQQTARPDLTSTTMLRLILDYAGSVEEAVELVSSYDLHDSATSSYHYMVADATGKSAILEWVAGQDDTDTQGAARELRVSYQDQDALEDAPDWQAVTNFVVTPGYYAEDAERKGLDRYERIRQELEAADGVLADRRAAMDILAQVGRRTWKNDDGNGCTVHSVVYDLTDRTALWVPNERYGDAAYEQELTLTR